MSGSGEQGGTAAELIAELDAGTGTELVEHGAFTLDRALAREKLANFRLPTPDLFAVLLVEVGHLIGASAIDFQEGAEGKELRVRLEQAELRASELEGMFDALFVRGAALEPEARRRIDAQRQLAICVEVVVGAERVFELVSVAADGSAHLLEAHSSSTGELLTELCELDAEQRPPWSGCEQGVFVRVSAPASLVRTTLQDPHKSKVWRRQLVRERCRYASVPVSVAGELISSGPRLAETERALIPVEAPVLAAGWSLARRESVLVFVVNGVVVEEVVSDEAVSGRVALVDATGLERDLSLFQLRRDEAYEQREEAAKAILGRVALGTTPGLAPMFIARHVGSDFTVGLVFFVFGLLTVTGVASLVGQFSFMGFISVLGLLMAVKGLLVLRRAAHLGREAALLRKGEPASATILRVREAPFPHSRQNMIVADVRLHRPGERSVELPIEMWQPGGVDAAKIRRGEVYYARVDPDNPRKAVLEPVPEAGALERRVSITLELPEG